MEKAAITEFANDMELNRIDMWLKVNILSLNLDKTHCMPFKNKNRCDDFTMGSETIKVTSAVKYLGVWIDENLKFCEHVDYLLKKLGKHLGVVARLRHFVSKNVLFNYYNFYVKPVLQYGLLIYGGNSFSNLDKLSVYQRKMIRLILFKKRNASIETDMIKYNVLSLTQLYFYDLIKFALRSVRKELSSEFLKNFIHVPIQEQLECSPHVNI